MLSIIEGDKPKLSISERNLAFMGIRGISRIRVESFI
jgi:hypothetical protein